VCVIKKGEKKVGKKPGQFYRKNMNDSSPVRNEKEKRYILLACLHVSSRKKRNSFIFIRQKKKRMQIKG
jgi:hypothetical protein